MKKILEFLTPKWISETWPKDSMGEEDKKTQMKVCLVFSAIFVAIYAMMYFNLFNTNLYDYYVRADWYFHVVSWASALFSIVLLWKSPDSNYGFTWAIPFLLLLAALLFGAGFDFDLRGIE